MHKLLKGQNFDFIFIVELQIQLVEGYTEHWMFVTDETLSDQTALEHQSSAIVWNVLPPLIYYLLCENVLLEKNIEIRKWSR